jgi:RNA polymerase sigma-70 factor (ECF subfamily)
MAHPQLDAPAVMASVAADHSRALFRFTDVYLRGEPLRRIADRLGVPVGTVKSRTHYAVKALRAATEPR